MVAEGPGRAPSSSSSSPWLAGQLASTAGRSCPVSREDGLNPAWRDAQGWAVRVGLGCRVGLGVSWLGYASRQMCIPGELTASSHSAVWDKSLEAPVAQPRLYKEMTSTAAGCGLPPHVPLCQPLAPRAASAAPGRAAAPFHGAQLLSTAPRGGTDFFPSLPRSRGPLSVPSLRAKCCPPWLHAGAGCKSKCPWGRLFPGDQCFSAQTEQPLKWLFRKQR